LDACAARSTLSIPIHSSTPCVASDSVSVLLAETLRSSALKLALLAIGLFGTVMFALIGYLYWSTVSCVRNRSDPAIAAEQIALKELSTAPDATSSSPRSHSALLIADSRMASIFSSTLRLFPSGQSHRLAARLGGCSGVGHRGRSARQTGQCYARPLRGSRTVLISW
jgi:hypothetical protein